MKKLLWIPLVSCYLYAMDTKDTSEFYALMKKLPSDMSTLIATYLNPVDFFTAIEEKNSCGIKHYPNGTTIAFDSYNNRILYHQDNTLRAHHLDTDSVEKLFSLTMNKNMPIDFVAEVVCDSRGTIVVLRQHVLSVYKKNKMVAHHLSNKSVEPFHQILLKKREIYYSAMALADDPSLLVVGTTDGTLLIGLPDTYNNALEVATNGDAVSCVAISKEQIFAGFMDGAIGVWNKEGVPLRSWKTGILGMLKGAAHNKMFLTSHENGALISWNMEENNIDERMFNTSKEQFGSCCYVAISSDGLFAITARSYSDSLRVWDMATGTMVNTLTINRHARGKVLHVCHLAISSDDSRIIIGIKGDDRVIAQIFDMSGYLRYKDRCGITRVGDKKSYPMLRSYFFNKLSIAQKEKTKLVLDSGMYCDKNGKYHRGFLHTIYHKCLNDHERQLVAPYIAIEDKTKPLDKKSNLVSWVLNKLHS